MKWESGIRIAAMICVLASAEVSLSGAVSASYVVLDDEILDFKLSRESTGQRVMRTGPYEMGCIDISAALIDVVN